MTKELKVLRKDLQEKFEEGTLHSKDEWTLSALNSIKRWEMQIRNDSLSVEQILEKIELMQEVCLILGHEI